MVRSNQYRQINNHAFLRLICITNTIAAMTMSAIISTSLITCPTPCVPLSHNGSHGLCLRVPITPYNRMVRIRLFGSASSVPVSELSVFCAISFSSPCLCPPLFFFKTSALLFKKCDIVDGMPI